MSKNCNSCEPTTPAVDTAPVDVPLDPSQAGVNKESVPDPRVPGAKIPMPEGVSVAIDKIWQASLTGSNFNSLTDPSEDQPLLVISTKKYEEQGANGLDKINLAIVAELEKLGYVANIVVGLAWDPKRFPTKPLLFQTNLKSSAHVEADYRTEFMPDYPYMRGLGDHELHAMVQLRQVSSTWNYRKQTYLGYTEFPHIGETATRVIRVRIVE